MTKPSASCAEDSGFKSRLCHSSDMSSGTLVATLPDAWRYRVTARTGWSGVSILRLSETERWVCDFSLSVAARAVVSVLVHEICVASCSVASEEILY